MKLKQIRILMLCLACCAMPLVFGGMTCKPSQERVVYNTLYSVEVSTTAAYDAYLAAVVKGTASTNDLRTVSQAYNDFQLVMKTAVLLLGNTNAPATPAVLDSAAKVTSAIGKSR